jgi:hypothetical protein
VTRRPKDIGAQLVPGDAGEPFDVEHAGGGTSFPERNSLMADPECLGQCHDAPGGGDGFVQNGFTHAPQLTLAECERKHYVGRQVIAFLIPMERHTEDHRHRQRRVARSYGGRDMAKPVAKWVPVISVDLMGITPKMFAEKQREFYEIVRDRPLNIKAVLKTGWNTITPEIAEEALLGKANRKLTLPDVQYYARQMLDDAWAPTGETICFTNDGVMRQGYHRMWACYLSGATFTTFVILDVEPLPDMFAYYDNGKRRSNVDALQTAGMNGYSPILDAVIKVAVRFDNHAYDRGAAKIMKMTPLQVLDYVREHEDIRDCVPRAVGEYKGLMDELYPRKKNVICFLAWRIMSGHGEEVLEDFMTELSSDVVNKTSPMFLLRQKLLLDVSGDPKKALSTRDALAFTVIAFNAWHARQSMKKLEWSVDASMPALTEPDEVEGEALEAAE